MHHRPKQLMIDEICFIGGRIVFGRIIVLVLVVVVVVIVTPEMCHRRRRRHLRPHVIIGIYRPRHPPFCRHSRVRCCSVGWIPI
jgi:hypothetical protein